jgi:hypothetical protein
MMLKTVRSFICGSVSDPVNILKSIRDSSDEITACLDGLDYAPSLSIRGEVDEVMMKESDNVGASSSFIDGVASVLNRSISDVAEQAVTFDMMVSMPFLKW